MSSIKDWISAARLRTLPLALSSIVTGAALAVEHEVFGFKVFLLCVITTLFLQVLSNYANDLGDFLRGTDNEQRIGPSRALQSGSITVSHMRIAVIIMSILSLISGLALIYHSDLAFEPSGLLFFSLGLLAILAAIKYTAGKKPYGYMGLGDISVFFFFGLLGVLGSYFLHKHSIPQPIDVFAASTIGFLSAAVLNLNNMRDAVPDEVFGKITMAVRLGRKNSRLYHLMLVSFGLISLLIYILYGYDSPKDLLALIVGPVLIAHLAKVLRTQEDRSLDGELKKVALSTFLISMLILASKLI